MNETIPPVPQSCQFGDCAKEPIFYDPKVELFLCQGHENDLWASGWPEGHEAYTVAAPEPDHCTKEQWEEMERVHGPIIELTPAIIDAIFNGDDDVVDNAPRFEPGFR